MKLIYSAASTEALSYFSPIEESLPEGTLLSAELHFADAIGSDVTDYINRECSRAGVVPWPGMSYIASASGDVLYLRWQKGMAWWVMILGIVLSIVLPPLLGAAIYAILPDWMKDLTNAIIAISVMGVMAYFMSKMSGVFK
jgi:hypothetical protein